jgi:tetratricopeptide (TPR) repeat protein
MNSNLQANTNAEVWAEMAVHLAWSEGLCLCFLFSDSSTALAEIRQLLGDASQARSAPTRIVAPDDAALAAAAVLQALQAHAVRMGAVRAPAWVEMLTVDQYGSTDWEAARATVLARLNEARAWLTDEFARPLLICLPEAWALRTPVIAPDLWHVRSYTARLQVQAADAVPVWESVVPQGNIEAWVSGPLEAYRQAQMRRHVDGSQGLARQRDVSIAAEDLGDVYLERQHIADALRYYRENLAICRQLHATLGDSPQALRDLSISLDKVGNAESAAGRNDAALGAYRESLAIRRQLHATLGDSPQALRDLSVSLNNVGDAESAAGRNDAALGAYRESLAICRQLHAALGDLPQVINDLAYISKKYREAEQAISQQQNDP